MSLPISPEVGFPPKKTSKRVFAAESVCLSPENSRLTDFTVPSAQKKEFKKTVILPTQAMSVCSENTASEDQMAEIQSKITTKDKYEQMMDLMEAEQEEEQTYSKEFPQQLFKYLAVKLGMFQNRLVSSEHKETVDKIADEMNDCFNTKKSRSCMICLKTEFDNRDEGLIDNAVLAFETTHNKNVRYISLDGRSHTDKDSASDHIIKNLFETQSQDSKPTLVEALQTYNEVNTLLVIGIKNMNKFLEAGHHNMKVLYCLVDSCSNNTVGSERMFVIGSYRLKIFFERRIQSRFDKLVFTVFDVQNKLKYILDMLAITDDIEVEEADKKTWRSEVITALKSEEFKVLLAKDTSMTVMFSIVKQIAFNLENHFKEEGELKIVDIAKSVESVLLQDRYIDGLNLNYVQKHFAFSIYYIVKIKKEDKFSFNMLYELARHVLKPSKQICFISFEEMVDLGLIYSIDKNTNIFTKLYSLSISKFYFDRYMEVFHSNEARYKEVHNKYIID